jgi:integrase
LHRAFAVAFCNWCIETSRLLLKPFSHSAKDDEDSDPRRKRRALTEDELRRLLDVARRRPLVDAMTIRRGKRKGEAVAILQPETHRQLERLGWERALIYKTLVLTGLRKGELASLTVGQLALDGAPACLVLDAADEKNREGSTIPLRADLAADLRQWLADKVEVAQQATKPSRRVHTLPFSHAKPSLPPQTHVFTVPDNLVKILDLDLVAAGIAQRTKVGPKKWKIDKRDERERTVEVHALRHSFGTLLSKGGVAPQIAQAAMRHSTIDLTMNVYTDPRLLDVAGAMEALPALPLWDGPSVNSPVESATVTEDLNATQFAPKFAPTSDKACNEVNSGQGDQRKPERH